MKRQERRKAARLAAENSSRESDAEKASEAQISEEVNENLEDVNNGSNETEEVNTDVYKCELCDFVSNKKSGLNIHMSRKHAHGMFLEQNIKSPDSEVWW